MSRAVNSLRSCSPPRGVHPTHEAGHCCCGFATRPFPGQAGEAPTHPTRWLDLRLVGEQSVEAHQSTWWPYISPSGSAISSMRAPSGSRK